MLKIEELREYHKNPRKISGDRFDHLSSSLKKLGDLGGIVVDLKTKQVIGGNQRVKTFLKERNKYEVDIVSQLINPAADGTVAYGYVIKDKGEGSEQRFSYREVDWTEEQCEEANIVANKITGMWDFDVLANQFDIDKLLSFGFSKQDLDLLPRDTNMGKDQDVLSKNLDSYLEGNIKQIVLFFKAEDFDNIMGRLDAVMKICGVPSNTEAFIKMLEYWENGHFAPEKEGPQS